VRGNATTAINTEGTKTVTMAITTAAAHTMAAIAAPKPTGDRSARNSARSASVWIPPAYLYARGNVGLGLRSSKETATATTRTTTAGAVTMAAIAAPKPCLVVKLRRLTARSANVLIRKENRQRSALHIDDQRVVESDLPFIQENHLLLYNPATT